MPRQRPITTRSSLVDQSGYTLIEITVVAALIATIGAVAVPGLLANLDDLRAIGAARYLSTRLQHARMTAILRSADVGLKFELTGLGYAYTTYVDGNHNGVRTTDIQRGQDQEIAAAERLPALFKGIDFGVIPGVPAVDPGSTPPGSDPIRLGASDILTFTPIGTSSTGSLYILGTSGAQYVVRVFGETGKTRVLKFDRRAWKWKPL